MYIEFERSVTNCKDVTIELHVHVARCETIKQLSRVARILKKKIVASIYLNSGNKATPSK